MIPKIRPQAAAFPSWESLTSKQKERKDWMTKKKF
jgi:hypothetical protein